VFRGERRNEDKRLRSARGRDSEFSIAVLVRAAKGRGKAIKECIKIRMSTKRANPHVENNLNLQED